MRILSFGHRKHFSFQDWSPWSKCKEGKIKRNRRSCTGRQDIESNDCSNDINQTNTVGGKILAVGGIANGEKVEIIDMNNQSFTCNGVPDFPLASWSGNWYVTGAGGLLEGNIPLICGRWRSSECYALTNRQWKVTNLKTPRIEIGSGK